MKHFLGIKSPDIKQIELRQEHYEKMFKGSYKIFHPTDRKIPHIDIYVFSPTKSRNYYTLITSGMSDIPMNIPSKQDYSKRIELLMYVGEYANWTSNLLKILAEYPTNNKTFFAPFNTVPMGARLIEKSKLCAFLFVPIEQESSELFSLMINGEPVSFLLAIPITITEYAYAREKDARDLYRRLSKKHLLICRDIMRKSVLDYKPLHEVK